MLLGAILGQGEMDAEGVTLETRLFDASSAVLTWTAMSSAAGAENARIKVFWELWALLTKALGKDKLVKLNSKEFKMSHF